jgi:hypothetical protein
MIAVFIGTLLSVTRVAGHAWLTGLVDFSETWMACQP